MTNSGEPGAATSPSTAPPRGAQTAALAEHVTIPLLGLDGFGTHRVAQADHARRVLSEEPGVRWAHVSAETEMAYVRYDPGRASVAALLAAITRCGLRSGTPSHQ